MKTLRLVFCLVAGLSAALAAQPPAPFTGNAPMKIVKTELPAFPAVANAYGLRRGEVRVAVAVDSSGRLQDYLIVGYTHRAFAEVTIDAIKNWRFEPMWIHGIPRGAVALLKFSFETEGTVVNLKMISDELIEPFFGLVQTNPDGFAACMPRDLDRIPTPTRIIQPVYPPEAHRRGHAGHVTVKFYIDQQGRVRLPRISNEAHETTEELAAWTLADAAVAAVLQWQFEPPLSNGKPTIVLVEQDFDFGTPSP